MIHATRYGVRFNTHVLLDEPRYHTQLATIWVLTKSSISQLRPFFTYLLEVEEYLVRWRFRRKAKKQYLVFIMPTKLLDFRLKCFATLV